jgi:hypothetical protein
MTVEPIHAPPMQGAGIAVIDTRGLSELLRNLHLRQPKANARILFSKTSFMETIMY